VSSFRFICIAALTVAMAGFVAGAAAAQSATATDQSGKPYLAGLRPPHEHQKPPHATSRVSAQHKAPGKTVRPRNETAADGGDEFESPPADAPCRQDKFAHRLAERGTCRSG
jgi:hypothetical protein